MAPYKVSSLTFLMFGKDNGFTTEQMSAWFSIIKSVHEMAVGVYFKNYRKNSLKKPQRGGGFILFCPFVKWFNG